MSLFPRGSAQLSKCGRYRYTLTRALGDGPTFCWVGHNPSTADADIDDPTLESIIRITRHHGGGVLVLVNVGAWRATDKDALARIPDPIGPENLDYICAAVRTAMGSGGKVIVAWGRLHRSLQVRWNQLAPQVEPFLRGVPLYCLGTNKDGSPRHPLYVAAATPLVRWPHA